jgi:hypothetical protein
VPFKAVDVLAEPEKREAIKQYSNWPTIPQLYVGGSSSEAATSCARCTHAGSSRPWSVRSPASAESFLL